jgi:hypothetical protein
MGKTPEPPCTFATSNRHQARRDRLLFHALAAVECVEPIPSPLSHPLVFLSLKEEIGWKAPLQNSNLWQQVI